MLRSLVLALAVAGAFSFSLAHRAPLPASNLTLVRDTVSSTIAGYTLDEIIAWSDAQFTRTISWGRYVRYGGTLILAGSLIYAALDWFYQQALQTTGTSLDDWYFSGSALAEVSDGFPCNQDDLGLYYGARFVYTGPNFSGGGTDCDRDWRSPSEATEGVKRYIESVFDSHNYPYSGWRSSSSCPITDNTDCAFVLVADRPSLPDWLQSNPDATDGVKRAVTDYIDQYPEWPVTFDEPLPGLSFSPVPNGNQWLDNPFFDPLLDTDNDGWPDWFEYDLYSDPSNPASQPPSTADPDNDGYDNATERDAGTDPTDPNSRPDVGVDQDSDGDGIKDSADPCPSDPTNSCQPEEDTQDEVIPDPIEPSLSPVDLPQFDQPALPDISSRFDQIEANFRDGLDSLWSSLQDRFPFGMARWIPVPPSVGGSSCDMSITLQIPDLPSAQVDICNNPVMQWAATVGRQLVLVSLMVGFLFAVARRASSV